MAEADPRTYRRTDVASFRKTNERFGGLSNMAPGFPITILDVRILTAEALYQACRFPHLPEVQRLIIAQTSPMTAKMRAKPHRNDSRSDWDAVRVPIMKWCLRVKLLQHWDKFGELLLETGDRAIVEDSRKDDFWGAMPDEEGALHGRNVLGRLLMEIREKLRDDPESVKWAMPVPIPNFLLLTREIPIIGQNAQPETLQPETLQPERVGELQALFNFTSLHEQAVEHSKLPPDNEPLSEPALVQMSKEGVRGAAKSRPSLYLILLGLSAAILALTLWLAR
ncbi:MAG TPA: NADAR family protein [Allosphingosinicella sp.]|jgi:ribA/ribD-fused uncharacterized protein